MKPIKIIGEQRWGKTSLMLNQMYYWMKKNE